LIVCRRLRIISIPNFGVPGGTEELHLGTPGSGGGGTGEAKGACSGAGGDNVSEKGPNFVKLATSGGFGSVGCGERSVWRVLLDQDGDCRVDDRRAGS